MDYVIKTIAHAWELSPAHYWHLRLLTSILLGPLVGVIYLVFFGGLWRPKTPKLRLHK